MKTAKSVLNERYYKCKELEIELKHLKEQISLCLQNIEANKLHRLKESGIVLNAIKVGYLIEKLDTLERILGDDE